MRYDNSKICSDCIDCIKQHETHYLSKSEWTCRYFHKIDLLDGSRIYALCSEARKNEMMCGKEARYFSEM